MTLSDIVTLLRTTPRMGAQKDNPEGVRYIHISDTLANEMAQAILQTFGLVVEQAHAIQSIADAALAQEMIYRAGLHSTGKTPDS